MLLDTVKLMLYLIFFFRFSFACVQPDGISGCFDISERFYDGRIENGNTWKLDANQVEVAVG